MWEVRLGERWVGYFREWGREDCVHAIGLKALGAEVRIVCLRTVDIRVEHFCEVLGSEC